MMQPETDARAVGGFGPAVAPDEYGPGARLISARAADAHPAGGAAPGSGEGGQPGGTGTADAASEQASGEMAAACDAQSLVLPPGQYIPRKLPVLHYGPVPAFHPDTWDLRIFGATESGAPHQWNWSQVSSMPRRELVADLHCVTKFTVPAIRWAGIPATDLLALAPPDPAVTHVMIWADYGYSANVRIGDFAADDALLATHRDGGALTPEHGYPLRLVLPGLYAWKSVKWVRAIEYLTRDRRGFWEERGYHNRADPWREQRYSYQEQPGEGPPP
jgi:DMSO/TMAO reductase YedYZ molybdopterin-dependent catalytic subunit